MQDASVGHTQHQSHDQVVISRAQTPDSFTHVDDATVKSPLNDSPQTSHPSSPLKNSRAIQNSSSLRKPLSSKNRSLNVTPAVSKVAEVTGQEEEVCRPLTRGNSRVGSRRSSTKLGLPDVRTDSRLYLVSAGERKTPTTTAETKQDTNPNQYWYDLENQHSSPGQDFVSVRLSREILKDPVSRSLAVPTGQRLPPEKQHAIRTYLIESKPAAFSPSATPSGKVTLRQSPSLPFLASTHGSRPLNFHGPRPIHLSASILTPPPITVAAMSASVLSRAYPSNEMSAGGVVVSAISPRPVSIMAASGRQRDKTRLLGTPGSGLRITFATDTAFVERKTLGSRGSSKAGPAALNLRPVQSTERPAKSRSRLPKATAATGVKFVTRSCDERLNPRRALDIARSYGVPKYFLRGNSQVMTDGRMRLFADNVWKKERTSFDAERTNIDSSDVIYRLMDSVDKAIGKSDTKGVGANVNDDDGVRLDRISLKSGGEDTVRDSLSSVRDPPSARPYTDDPRQQPDKMADHPATTRPLAALRHPNTHDVVRPHTVDSTQNTPRHRVNFWEPETNIFSLTEGKEDGYSPPATAGANFQGLRVSQLASGFRHGTADSIGSQNANLFGERYQNVLPRFYPALTAHKSRMAEAERGAKIKKKSGHQRLVRFADTHTVRFSNEAMPRKEPIAGIFARRAPTQSVQRALDSHSGLAQAERMQSKSAKNNVDPVTPIPASGE